MTHPCETQLSHVEPKVMKKADFCDQPTDLQELIDSLEFDADAKAERFHAGMKINASLNADGTATHTVAKGDTLSNISADLLKEEHKGQAHYKPSKSEIEAVMHDLEELNPGALNALIPGQKLTIPKEHVAAARNAQGESLVVHDADGRVSEIFHPSGVRTEIGRYPDGKIATVEDAGGTMWINNPESGWLILSTDTRGRFSVRNVVGCVEVSGDGTVTLANETEGVRTTQFADGITFQENAFEMEMKRP